MDSPLDRTQLISNSALTRIAQTLEDDAEVLHSLEKDSKRELALRHAVHYLRVAANPDYELGPKFEKGGSAWTSRIMRSR